MRNMFLDMKIDYQFPYAWMYMWTLPIHVSAIDEMCVCVVCTRADTYFKCVPRTFVRAACKHE
jgi:hypothetical protein